MSDRTRTRVTLPGQQGREVIHLGAPPTVVPEARDRLDAAPARRASGRAVAPGVSGTYLRRPWLTDPVAATPADQPEAPRPPAAGRTRSSEDLRVDVDGWYPQGVVSGTIRRGLARRLDWHARVVQTASGSYRGVISYRNGDVTLLPQTTVEVTLVGRGSSGGGGSATATFSGTGLAPRVRAYTFSTSSFHPVSFEYDTTADSGAVTTFDLGSHPNRPGALPVEALSIESVFRRAGFAVTKSGGDSTVPMAASGSDLKWTEQELNDAMATYWSAYTDAPAWAAWGLFAGQSVDGAGLGGIMFDYTGSTTPQRQGCVVFSKSFISEEPAGDPDGPAYVQRMRFWTAVHELGHAFNLAHAWNKNTGTWIPTANEAHLRSYMNYPHRFTGGANAFFSDFRYSFSDSELMFLRHAPERFVRMGDAAWFTDHGFEQAGTIPGSPLTVTLRAHRPSLRYEFLEPVTLELKLENTGTEAVVLDAGALDLANCTVVVQRRGAEPKQLVPYSTRCLKPRPMVLEPGASMYGSVTVSSGRDGWILAEPGDHVVQVAVHLADEDVVTQALSVRVLTPESRDEERVAQDVLTPEVGRVLASGGTRRDGPEAGVLREAAERLAGRAFAAHAHLALGRPLAGPGKQLVVTTVGGRPQAQEVVALGADPGAAATEMAPALADLDRAADTFGHIAVGKRVAAYARALGDAGRTKDAAAVGQQLHEVLAARGVLPEVLAKLPGGAPPPRSRA